MNPSWLLLLSWLLVDDVVGDVEKGFSSRGFTGGLGCSSEADDQLSPDFIPGARDICGDPKPGCCCSDAVKGHMWG